MKIILSRKGFDSASGGYPSPLFIEENQLVSFPIPENDIDTGITYKDLVFNDNLTYTDIMNDLGIKGFENRFVDLDPDLKQSTIRNRDSKWRGIFGQCNRPREAKGDQKLFDPEKAVNCRKTFQPVRSA